MGLFDRYKSHGLGIGHGSMVEDTKTGMVEHRPTGKILPGFKVRLSDVTGVSMQRERHKLLHVEVVIHGQGSVLAREEVNWGTAEKIEQWFKDRIGLGATRTVNQSPVTSPADEIVKLKSLLDQGIITAAQFEASKQKLLGA